MELKCAKSGDEYDQIRNIRQRAQWHNDINIHYDVQLLILPANVQTKIENNQTYVQ